MYKPVPPDLNIRREKIILKGFANIPDIATFANCSYPYAKKEYKKIQNVAKKENKRMRDKTVPTCMLLEFYDLTEEGVFRFAELERQRIKDLSPKPPEG